MAKEEALEDFLNSLKIAFNIAALYKKEHPSFIKAVKEFQNKVDAALDFFNPIKIGVTPDYLMVEGKLFSAAARYKELANMFHQRRIMSIEIQKGIILEELIIFLSNASAPQKEIFKEGGLVNILARENIKHVFVAELDYSQLLEGEGGECPDVWGYLLKDAIANDDGRKINQLADNFDNLAKHLKAEELLKNEEINANTHKFFKYLKNQDNSKFLKCLKEMVKSIIRDNSLIVRTNLEKLKAFFGGLNESDLSSVLSEEILYNENFDSLSFNLFCRLVGNRDHEKIAFLTGKSLKSKDIKNSSKIKKKIESLFCLPNNPTVSEVYCGTLAFFLKELTFDRNQALDRNFLKADYRFILLNLLGIEEDKGQIKLILERLSQVWEEIIRDNDFGYLKLLLEISNKKRKGNRDFDIVFVPVDKLISNFVENIIWDEPMPLEIGSLIDILQSSSHDSEFYLNKIFNENKVNSNVLKLFLKFFPDSVPVFCGNLEKKHSDMDFIEKIIDSMAKIDTYLSIEILKCIYCFSNNLLKIEALKAMGFLSQQDNSFLFSVLREADTSFRKEALRLLIRDAADRQDVLEGFFLMPSPWGAKNNILLENIMIVEEMSLFEAADYLERLSKRRFFWNSNVRARAKEVLRKWHDKKD